MSKSKIIEFLKYVEKEIIVEVDSGFFYLGRGFVFWENRYNNGLFGKCV